MITPAPPDAASARARTKLPEVAVIAWPLALAMSGSPLLTAAPVTSLVMPRIATSPSTPCALGLSWTTPSATAPAPVKLICPDELTVTKQNWDSQFHRS